MTSLGFDMEERAMLAERVGVPGLHAALLLRVPSTLRDRPVLDLGCGTGAWLERLSAAEFSDLTGVDADRAQYGSTRARHLVADLNRGDLPLPARHFALITAIEVIEHLECLGHFLDLIERHLASDGICLITTPNVHSLRARLRYFLTDRLPAFDDKGELTHVVPVFLPLLKRMLVPRRLGIVEQWTYPPRGSVLFRPAISTAAAFLRPMFPDSLPGDVLCLMIRRVPR